MEPREKYREDLPQEVVTNSDFESQTISRIHQLLASFNSPETIRVVEDRDMKIEFLNQKPGKIHYALTLCGVKYFLKEVSTLDNKSMEGGSEEFEDAQEAAELLSDLAGVEVLKSSFAFSYGTKKYNGAEWNKHAEKPLSRILSEYESGSTSVLLTEVLKSSISTRIHAIQNRLHQFKDVTVDNMGYDFETDTIIVFDINKERGGGLRECSDDEL